MLELSQDIASENENWYVLHTKPHKERVVADAILAKNQHIFLPLYQANRVNLRSALYRPYFPGYVFVRPMHFDDLAGIRWLPGVNKFVEFDGVRAVVPPQFIEQLRERLGAMQGVPSALRGKPQFEKGQALRIVSGPFQDYNAIFDEYIPGKERVKVLLEMLYQYAHEKRMAIPLEINPNQLSAKKA